MTSVSSVTNLRGRMETTARAFLSAFEEGSVQNNPALINRDVTADCTRTMLPASMLQALGIPDEVPIDTTQFQEQFAKDIQVLRFKNNTMANLVIDTEAGRAAFTSIAEVHPRNGEWYSAEQAWVLYFNEDGSKVRKVIEFCDKDVILKMANTVA